MSFVSSCDSPMGFEYIRSHTRKLSCPRTVHSQFNPVIQKKHQYLTALIKLQEQIDRLADQDAKVQLNLCRAADAISYCDTSIGR
jgi:hypothetical protein